MVKDIVLVHRSVNATLHFLKKGVQHLRLSDHEAVYMPIRYRFADDLFDYGRQSMMSRTEVNPACHASVKAQAPQVDPFIAVAQRM